MFRNAFSALILAIAPLLVACGQMDVNIDGDDGVPLADLDMAGPPPTRVVLAGPDHVIVTEGAKMAIAVDATTGSDAMRFSLKDGTLGIMRKHENDWHGPAATVRVTMPNPHEATVAGSGTLDLAGLDGDVELTVAGSGTALAKNITAGKLTVTVAGSGELTAAGRANTLDLTIAGAGEANMDRLTADGADVTIAGSGDATFASDGKVAASIMGSGKVRVTGNASCKVESMGSGSLICGGGPTGGATPSPHATESN